MSLSPFIGFSTYMNGRKMLLSFFSISQQGTKRELHSIKGTTYEETFYDDAFQGWHYETPYITHYTHILHATVYEQHDPRTCLQ